MKSKSHFVLLGLCTYHRPRLLSEALESLTKLDIPRELQVELTLVDNENSITTQRVLDQVKDKLAFKTDYRVESQRGIAYARNKVLEAALEKKADAIAFFDDDARVAPDWLALLYSYYSKNKVEVVTGPQKSILPPGAPLWAYKSEFLQGMRFSTDTERPWAATHNVFFDMILVREWGLRFDTDFALTGGDDQFFFMQAVQKGARIRWLEKAIVSEKVSPERLSLSWVLRRNFRHSCDGARFYKKLFGRMKASFFSIAKGTLYLSYGFTLMLPSVFLAIKPGTRHYSIKALGYISRGLGWLCGCGGFRYEEYRRR